jgi:hypothetical protein
VAVSIVLFLHVDALDIIQTALRKALNTARFRMVPEGYVSRGAPP